jgi:hypothetical protein
VLINPIIRTRTRHFHRVYQPTCDNTLIESDVSFCFYAIYATFVNILLSSSLYCHYMFQPNQQSSGVQVAVMKDSAAHCLLLVMWVNSLFYLDILELNMFALWFYLICCWLWMS